MDFKTTTESFLLSGTDTETEPAYLGLTENETAENSTASTTSSHELETSLTALSASEWTDGLVVNTLIPSDSTIEDAALDSSTDLSPDNVTLVGTFDDSLTGTNSSKKSEQGNALSNKDKEKEKEKEKKEKDKLKSLFSASKLAEITGDARIVRVNVGGSENYLDSQGQLWAADSNFTRGKSGKSFKTLPKVTGTTDSVLFQSGRQAEEFEYLFALPNGDYEVRLSFVETPYVLEADQREFQVKANQQVALDEVDVIQEVKAKKEKAIDTIDGIVKDAKQKNKLNLGKNKLLEIEDAVKGLENDKIKGFLKKGKSKNKLEIKEAEALLQAVKDKPETNTALTQTFKVKVKDGFLDLNLKSLKAEAARLSSIEIVPDQEKGNKKDKSDDSLLSVAQTNTLTLADEPLLPVAQTNTLTLATASANQPTASAAQMATPGIRINAGGGDYTDSAGNLWQADDYFTAGNTSLFNVPIAGTVEDTLYQTERYQNTFGYEIPVDNGTYTVNLHFAENFFNLAGQRVFDATVEGQLLNDNLDIVYATGNKNTALITSVAGVNVSDGILNIDLAGVVDKGKISAIEVLANPSTDTILPTANLNGADVTQEGGTDYQFEVIYSDNQTVDLSTLDNNDLLITGPNGFSQLATLDNVKLDSNGTPMSAMYSILAPGGTWDSGDNGTYDIAQQANQVIDTSGNAVSSGSLGTFNVNATPPAPTDVRINSGGGDYTDSEGNLWLADTYFTNGNTSATGAAIDGTVEDTLYQTERWRKNFGYEIPVINGTYAVNLHFAETFFNLAGQRVFDATVEGQLLNDNLDIISVTGAKNTALITSVAGVNVSDGILNIDFAGVADKAKISAIEVLANPSADTLAPTASLNAADVTQEGGTNYQFSVTYADNEAVDLSTLDNNDLLVTGPNGFSQLATLDNVKLDSNGTPMNATYSFLAPGGTWDSGDNGTYDIAQQANQVIDTSGNAVSSGSLGTFDVNAAPPEPTDIRINVGGGDYTDTQGNLWLADTHFTSGNTSSTNVAIDGTVEDTLYQTERYHSSFGYDIPVVDSTYTVNLHFAEIYFNQEGQRAFDVAVEGNPFLNNLDILSVTGTNNTALTTSLANVTVTDGVLDLDLNTLVNNAKLSAIEILATPTPDTIVPTASLSATDVTYRGGTEYQFSVTYFDNQVIDSTTPDNNDILVTGPNGFSQLATLETIQPDSNGSPLKAIYKFAAPGGNWDGTDDGTYAIALEANQVSDASGNVVASGTLGSFDVAVAGTALPPTLVNSGGPDYTAVDSRLWQADTYFVGGGTNAIAATTDIGNTFDDTLYQTERWHNNTLSYEIPVPEQGTYTVNLDFAEIYWADAGLRVFDVIAEGNLIADDLDIYAQVGGNAALSISDNVGVTDGVLNIDLVGVVEKPKISSIEVVKEENTHAGHPFLHVVIDAPEYAIDYNGNGSEQVSLLGNESHTHEPGKVLTSWTWENGATVLGTGEDIQASLGVGAHTVSLTIEDSNSPPDHLTDSVDLNIFPINAVGGVLVSYDLDADIDNLTAPEFQEVRPLTPQDPNDLLDGTLHLKESGSFGTLGSSPYSNQDVAVLFKGKFAPTTAGDYDFTVNGGTDSDIYINGNLVTGTETLTAATTYDLEVRVARAAGEVNPIEVLASIDGAPPAPLQGTSLTHDQTSLDPFINPPTDNSVSTFGGQILTLEGIAFWEGDASDQVTVHWSNTTAGNNTTFTEPDIQVNQGEITFTTPPGTLNDIVNVKVETPNGMSNEVTFVYAEGVPPIKFLAEQQTGATPFGPTQATWGPDGRLYVGAITGAIEIYTFDDNYQVTNTQTVSSIAGLSNSNILGIAFNPFDDPAESPKIYVAHSELFAHNGGQGPVTEFSPYNGQVSILEGPNFSTVTPLITGLPVSNHDHGINGLTFDNNGDLLIAVGGNTNAGVADNNIGGLPESPLSGAILKANITDPNFNGTVEYELTPGETAPSGFDANDQVYGELVNVVSGVDVSVFASGQRNPFDIVWTTQDKLYGTDNGANASSAFGPASTGANTEKSITGQPDEINLLIEGNYYGHANRNQGRFDPRQYVWYSPNDTGDFTPPLGTVASSTNGISEYRATTFLGEMQGNLLAQKWNGTLYNAALAADGSFESLETIINVPTALDVLHGPGGAILGIDFTDNQITVSLPDDLAAVFDMTAYDIFPWRSPAVGGATFTIGGANFDPDLANTTVTIGGQTAMLTSVSANRIQGIIPEQTAPTGGLLDVVVTNDGATSTIPDAFVYLSSTLAFGDTEFTVNEDGTAVAQVSVTRTGVSFGAVSATLSQTDGTATSGVDYTNAPITVSFADGETGTKVVSIPILEDTEVEGDEIINLLLDSPSSWARIGAQGEATLRILDNEALPTTTASATFTIDPPAASINGSTFGSGSFQITNTSTSGEKLDRVVIDLSSSILPDLVFDPNGTAGDAAAKAFTIDSDSGVGYLSHTLLSSHDGGFDALEILFNDFDPTETLTFSIDVDPTSIKGLPQPGPSDSADVSGLELTGTQVRTDFDDGSTLVGDTYRIPNSVDGSQVTLQSDLPGQPTISAVGLSSTRAKVSNENQTIQVTGPAGAEVMLLVTEAALFTENGDGNAFDVDPFEANSIIAITEQSATLDGTGTVDIPVTLTKSDPEGGLNYIVAVVKYLDGTTSPLSDTIILELL